MAEHSTSVLNALTKEVYADSLENLIPDTARLQKDIKYKSSAKEGKVYVQPMQVTRPAGWTLNTEGTAFTLNEAVPTQSRDARVNGSSFVLEDLISYDAAARAVKGKAAFVDGTSWMLENMAETASFILESQLLHGQDNVGIVDARTDDSGTTQTFSFTAATFMPAFLSGLEGTYVEFYDDETPLTPTTAQITAVDIENLAVTFEGVEAELDAVAGATNPQMYLRNTYDHGMIGLMKQAGNLTEDLFGIDPTEFSLLAGNEFTAGGTLTFATLMRAVSKPTNRGLREDVTAYVSTNSWTDAMNDLSALRRFSDKAGGKIEQGGDELMFHSQNGMIRIVPHLLMKPSEALVIPTKKCIRLGASEPTFRLPGTDVGRYWDRIDGHAGYGTRCYWNQAVLLVTPNKACKISGIVNQS